MSLSSDLKRLSIQANEEWQAQERVRSVAEMLCQAVLGEGGLSPDMAPTLAKQLRAAMKDA